MKNKPVLGFFEQELKVGDYIAFCATSYSRSYMRDGVIVQTHNNKGEVAVKITYPKHYTRWVYDYHTKRGRVEDLGIRQRVSRIFNTKSAITLKEGEGK